MGMAKLALTILRMTFHMVLVMLMTTAALVFMLVMLMAAATLVFVVMVFMLMVLMLVMLIATAAVVVVVMMLLMTMLVVVLMGMHGSITVAVGRDMPHAAVVMILATMSAGAALRMLAIILIPLNTSVHVPKAAHLSGAIAYIF